MTNIPTDAEFKRASRLMAERSRNLDEIRVSFIHHFSTTHPLHDFYILPQRDVNFRTYIFFEKNSDIEKYKNNGGLQVFEDFIFSELERVGRGRREEITVAFELDSNENIETNFEGDYLLRLR
jgi:hypothetical protein